MRWRAPRLNAATISLNAAPRGTPLLLREETSSIPQTRPTAVPAPSGRAQNQAQTWIFSPKPPRGCVSICRSRTPQTGRNPKLEVSFNIFDPHNVPDNILAAGTTFCQEVHGLVGRGQLSGHHGTPGAVREPNPKSYLCLPSGEGWCRVHIWAWASDRPDLESSSG